jgi:hypothetical protein
MLPCAAAGSIALFFFLFHPYHVPTIIGVLGFYIIIQSFYDKKIRWDLLKFSAIAGVISSPAILYHFWALSNFWTRQQHALQNNLITPPLYNFLLSYGLLFVLSLFGLSLLIKKKNKGQRDLFLISWWTAQIALPYLPIFNFQRKLMEGLHFILVITAILGLLFIKQLIKDKFIFKKYLTNPVVLIIFFAFSFALSNYSIVARDSYFSLSTTSTAYLKKEKMEPMLWLRNNSSENSIILSSYSNSNLIPAFSLRKVYLGHWGMTADAEKKEAGVKLFFAKYSPTQQKSFLKANSIDYIFYGQEEKKIKNFNPEKADYLEKVYQNSEVEIYKVLEN